MRLPPIHHAVRLEDVAEVAPDLHQPGILALTLLLTAPPVVLAAAQECHPPEVQARDNRLRSLAEIDTQDSFVLVRVQVNDGRALMLYEDVNGRESARQEIPGMDFPRNSTSLYACRDGEHWVIVLPSEY